MSELLLENLVSKIFPFFFSNCNFFSVPPEIDDLKTSSDVHVNEGDEANLECRANGHPKPEIKWLREDRSNFTIYDKNNKRMIGRYFISESSSLKLSEKNHLDF